MERSKSSAKAKHSEPTEKALNQLKTLGVVSLSEIAKLGISRPTLSRLTASGALHRLRNGFYVHPDSKTDPKDYDFAVACQHFGKNSVIGGLSALFYHGLLDQAPRKIWVLVSYEQKSRSTIYRCIRTKTKSKIGIEDHGVFRITNLERTIVEALYYSAKVGLRTALKAARTAILDGRTTEAKLAKQASSLGLRHVIEKHWDAIAA